MNRFAAFDDKPTADTLMRQPVDARWRIAAAAACGMFAVAGFVVGAVFGLQRASEHNHSRGACIALEFAENFGVVGAIQKRQAMHAMSTSAGRHHGLFPKSVTEFEDLCIRTWTSDVRLGR